MTMKQYFIGISQRSQDLLLGLLDLGATLMFTWHPVTVKLNDQFGFYDGEWLLLTCVTHDWSEIEEVRSFLENQTKTIENLNFKIIYYQELYKEEA